MSNVIIFSCSSSGVSKMCRSDRVARHCRWHLPSVWHVIKHSETQVSTSKYKKRLREGGGREGSWTQGERSQWSTTPRREESTRLFRVHGLFHRNFD